MKNMMKRKKRKSKKKSNSQEPFEYSPSEAGTSFISKLESSDSQNSEMTTEMMCQLYEGQLSKYTNVVKGWQFRWFILDPKTGILSYYINEHERKQSPRGWAHLEGAVISPSDEDSNTFTVNPTSGESFKLRAQDAKARQEWVNRLRAVSQLHVSATAQNNPPLPPREHLTPKSIGGINALPTTSTIALWDAFTAVRQHLFRAEQSNFLLARAIEDLPNTGELKHTDPDLLKIKATSQALLMSLNHCLFILEQQTQDVGTKKDKPSSKSEHSSFTKKKFPL